MRTAIASAAFVALVLLSRSFSLIAILASPSGHLLSKRLSPRWNLSQDTCVEILSLSLLSDVPSESSGTASSTDRVFWVDPSFLQRSTGPSLLIEEHAAFIRDLSARVRKLNAAGPWTVAFKNASLVPNGDPHEYVTFARYSWPKNTTATNDGTNYTQPAYCYSPETVHDPVLIWKTCQYEGRDGHSTPDADYFGDAASFRSLAYSSLMNSILYVLTCDVYFAQRLKSNVRTWFIDSNTAVRPDVNFGQIVRGPKMYGTDNDWSTGTFRGSVDWRRMVKVANAVAVMRKQGCEQWDSQDDDDLAAWAQKYDEWFQTSPLSLKAKNSANNLQSFWYAQALSIQILKRDGERARSLAKEYFDGPFRTLIGAQGFQPQEAMRTRSLHYQAFGVEAMIANAQIAGWLGLDMWQTRSTNGTTINDAVNYALSLQDTAKPDELSELAPHVAAVLAVYGDYPDKRYSTFLANVSLTGDPNRMADWRLFSIPGAYQIATSPDL